MTPLAVVLLLVAMLGIVRTLWWQYRSPAPARSWRLALLCGMQLVTATLLWRTLEPPFRSGDAGILTVATARAPRLAAMAAGDAIVALPEAPALPGVARLPDLATALRRHPGTTGLRIIGEGLPARDRTVTGWPLAFDPAPLPRGLVALTAPTPVAPGAAFRVGGSVHDVPGGRVDLLDPAGRVVAGAPLGATGDFALSATARATGPAEFGLRVTDRGGRRVETAIVPVVAVDVSQPRLLIVAGAAGPDLKYLRRWAADAGIATGSSIAAGNGLDLGDAPPRLDAANLARLDLLVLDERSWAALNAGERARVLAAVRAGLGIVLRVTGPLSDATRRDWAALGFAVDDATRPVRLSGNAMPLTRLVTGAGRADAALLLRDAAGNPLGQWRAFGRGRMGLWPVTDIYTMVLSDAALGHAAIWSEVFATLARPQPQTAPRISPDASPGQRVTICNLGDAASVGHPDGSVTKLIVDAGCAGFWPRSAGWHELRAPAPTPMPTPFLVAAPGAGRAAAEARTATLALVGSGRSTTAATPVRCASWPWFIAWVAAAALLWWFERSRIGRTASA